MFANVVRSYIYDKSNNTAKITDHTTNVTTTFRYDLIGRTLEIKCTDGQRLQFNYDIYNRISASKWLLDNYSYSTEYIYGDTSISGQKTGLIYGIKLNGTQVINYQYDDLSRMVSKTLQTITPYVTEYTYLDGTTENSTTTLVGGIKNGNDILQMYEYEEKRGVVYCINATLEGNVLLVHPEIHNVSGSDLIK